MGCVLRASGAAFDVDSFLKNSGLRPLVVYHRGEARAPASNPAGRKHERSGMNVSVSEREFSDLAGQIKDAIQFLAENAQELTRLRDYAGLEGLEVDFPVEDRDVAAQTDAFPAELMSLLGKLRIGLAVSRYPPPAGSSSR